VHHVRSDAPRSERLALTRAALVALTVLERKDQMIYTELVIGTTPISIYRQALEEVKASEALEGRRYELPAFIREGASFCMGREEGVLEGLRLALLEVIELRGLHLDDRLRVRIERCKSRRTLERWRAAAKTCPVDASMARVLRSRRVKPADGGPP